MSSPRVLETALLTLDAADGSGIPGYLVLRLAGPAFPLGQLPVAAAGPVMSTLARAAAAIESVVAADRVYLLSFCEVDRRLHFHLFPRTAWLLEAWRAASGEPSGPVNGPLLFEWARNAYPAGCALPPGVPTVEAACEALRRAVVDPQA